MLSKHCLCSNILPTCFLLYFLLIFCIVLVNLPASLCWAKWQRRLYPPLLLKALKWKQCPLPLSPTPNTHTHTSWSQQWELVGQTHRESWVSWRAVRPHVQLSIPESTPKTISGKHFRPWVCFSFWGKLFPPIMGIVMSLITTKLVWLENFQGSSWSCIPIWCCFHLNVIKSQKNIHMRVEQSLSAGMGPALTGTCRV